MRTIRHDSKSYSSEIAELDRRAAPSGAVRETVSGVIDAVSQAGDDALIALIEENTIRPD